MVTFNTRLPLPALLLHPPCVAAIRPCMATLALVSANIIWAGSAVASKPMLAHMPPLAMATLRVAIALVVLRAVLAQKRERPTTGGMPALLGFFGVTLFCGCQNLGLLYADATMIALITGVIPVLTVSLAVPVLGEQLSGSRLAGLLISLLGISVIVLVGTGETPVAALSENVLPMASAVSSALYSVLGRRAFVQGSALALVAGSTQYGLIFLLPGAAFEVAIVGPGYMTIRDGLLLLYLGAGCSALAFLLRGYGLTHLEAGHSAVYGNLKPLVGVALAVVLLGEPLTADQIGGGLLILIGVGIASRQWSSRRGTRPRSGGPAEAVALPSTS